MLLLYSITVVDFCKKVQNKPEILISLMTRALTCWSGAAREVGAAAAAPFALFQPARPLQSAQTLPSPGSLPTCTRWKPDEASAGETFGGCALAFCLERDFVLRFYARLWCRLVSTAGFRSAPCGEKRGTDKSEMVRWPSEPTICHGFC